MTAPSASGYGTGAASSGPGALLVVTALGAMFLATLDQTVVATALPAIVRNLGGGSVYTWVVAAYLLTSTVTLPLYGRLSDLYGRRELLLAGLALFLVGSLLCAAAQTMGQLIGARALQGLGAGALLPISLSLIADMFRAGKVARLSALIGITMAASYVAGPALGGLLTDFASWRWIFLANLPIVAVLGAAAMIAIPRGKAPGSQARPDYLGIAILSGAIGIALTGLTEKGLANGQGRLNDWLSLSVAGLVCIGLVLLAPFIFVERRAALPIVPVAFFRNRMYAFLNLISFFTSFGLYTAVVLLPRYFESVQHMSATVSGFLLYPMLAGLVISSMVTGSIIGRTRRYRAALSIAMGCEVAGCLLIAFLTPRGNAALPIAAMILIGLGIGPLLSGLTVVIQDVVAPQHTGMASAALTFFRQIGGAVALTVAGSAYDQRIHAFHSPGGLDSAATGAVALIMPLFGGIGAVVSLLLFISLPEWPLWGDRERITAPLETVGRSGA